MNSAEPTQVVADLGGTNFRLARVHNDVLKNIASYRCSDYSSVTAVLTDYLQHHCLTEVALCLAVASPIQGDRISMTNLAWEFSRSELQQSLNLTELLVINDFAAQAMAIPGLGENQKIRLGGKAALVGKPITVCGPGTGLGVAHLLPGRQEWEVVSCEGGHVDFSPTDEVEIEILRSFQALYGHVSAERILSGPGLVQLYRSLCAINRAEPQPLSAVEVSRRALSAECQYCLQSLQRFCAILGSFCGDLALTMGAFGGVYITGGIIPQLIPFVRTSEFRCRFEAKGRYQKYNANIPCFVVTASDPALSGAAAYLKRSLTN